MSIPLCEVPINGREMILVVDDCDTVRQYIGAVLRIHGYSVIEAASGGEAVEVSQRYTGRIDLLITDVVLPDETGQDVAQQLSAIWLELPVLYISGYPRDFLGEGALPPGIGFLQKPFASDALVRQVRVALRKQMPYRILVVDDDPLVTRCAGQALSHSGFEVLVAENGKRAKAIFTEQSVDLVIADIVMPEMEGLEMIIALRKSRPLLPIVAISGADEQYLKLAVAFGARAALAKPLSMTKLLETVQQALQSGPARGVEPDNRSTDL